HQDAAYRAAVLRDAEHHHLDVAGAEQRFVCGPRERTERTRRRRGAGSEQCGGQTNAECNRATNPRPTAATQA
ncbi:MAG: hypothetical protein ACK595_02935, partial [Planctomycetota bacterium]